MVQFPVGWGAVMGTAGTLPIHPGRPAAMHCAGRPSRVSSPRRQRASKASPTFTQALKFPDHRPVSTPGVSLPARSGATRRTPGPPTPQPTRSLDADPPTRQSDRVGAFRFLGGPLGGLQRAGPRLPPRRRNRDASVASAAAAAGDDPQAKKTFLGMDAGVWSKIVPLGLMFFCILFNYTILRDTKDVLVVTAPGSGAEIIPFLKTWVNLPLAIGFTILYAALANVLSTEMLFYACIIPFIIFFWSFAYVLYPLRDVLHPTEFSKHLLDVAGPRFAGPIAILRNWTFCLFYVMAELWGSVVVSVLFWGFANQITSVDEATTFYPLFGLGANVALIFSGRAVKYFSQVRAGLPPGVDGWGISLKGLMGMVVIGGLIITGIYYWMNRQVVPNIPKRASKKKKKTKMSVGESFKFLANSKYIRNLATLVIAYGVSINLVEVTWKGKIKAQFPNPNDYSAFMGDFSTCTGAATLVMMLLSRFIFTRFGWGVAALITPTVLAITGALFFGLIIFGEPLLPMLSAINMTPLYLAVLVGAAQNIFSKSSKYSLFDPCKETAYIPLDDEVRTKGKAAIDVICNPLGKSGGALIQQMLIISFGSLAACAPYLATIVIGVVVAWILAARSLDKQFTELQKEEMRAKLAEAKRELLQKAKAEGGKKSLRFTSKATEDGFAEGRWVAESGDIQRDTTDTSAAGESPQTDTTVAGGNGVDEKGFEVASSPAQSLTSEGEEDSTDAGTSSQETSLTP